MPGPRRPRPTFAMEKRLFTSCRDADDGERKVHYEASEGESQHKRKRAKKTGLKGRPIDYKSMDEEKTS